MFLCSIILLVSQSMRSFEDAARLLFDNSTPLSYNPNLFSHNEFWPGQDLIEQVHSLSVVITLHNFLKCKGCFPLSSKPHSSFIYMSHRHRAMRWESSVLNWGVCLDRLDKYFFCVVVSSSVFGPDSHRRGSEQSKLQYIMSWVAFLSKTHGCLTSCLSVYTSPLAIGIN